MLHMLKCFSHASLVTDTMRRVFANEVIKKLQRKTSGGDTHASPPPGRRMVIILPFSSKFTKIAGGWVSASVPLRELITFLSLDGIKIVWHPLSSAKILDKYFAFNVKNFYYKICHKQSICWDDHQLHPRFCFFLIRSLVVCENTVRVVSLEAMQCKFLELMWCFQILMCL